MLMSPDLFPATLDPHATVFVNGDWTELGSANVSVLDRGFLFGDGVYEAVPVYARQPFRLQEHFARLHRSLNALSIQSPFSYGEWSDIVHQIIRHQSFDEQVVYIQVTRGVAKRDHAYPVPAVKPTVFLMSTPMRRPTEKDREVGLSAITLPDERWLHCDIKSISLLGNVLARQAAVAEGADEAILFRNGVLTEGAASNIWISVAGELFGSRKTNLVLEGIRYSLIETLAQEIGTPFSLQDVSLALFNQADEVMLSSATKEILPITRINNQKIGNGKPGPVYRKLRQAYDSAITASTDAAA